jgi:4,5-dihydroxyphthalate decarboxylase
MVADTRQGTAAKLHIAIGTYAETGVLRSGAVRSDLVELEFADIKPINRAFAPMVREARFDVSEMAIATFLQAKAYDIPLVLLPIVLAARFQETALLCRADKPLGPGELSGCRIGVRAYSQTTGMWLRGILGEFYGIVPQRVKWITFEDAHVPFYRDPPWAERAPVGRDMLDMLRAGDLDAVIVGNDPPNDPELRLVFDAKAAQEIFWRRHHFVPINHMVTIRRDLAESRPDLVHALYRMFLRARAKNPQSVDYPLPPWTRSGLREPLDLALRYSQDLLPRAIGAEDIWEGLPEGIG